jgi:hypothetical protein
LESTYVRALITSGTNLFAGTDGGGIFLSTDNGQNWTAVNSGLTNLSINALTVSGTNLFAVSDDCVSLSSNNGKSWTSGNSIFGSWAGYHTYSLAVSGSNLFIGTNRGVYISTDNGTNCSQVYSAVSHTGGGFNMETVRNLVVEGVTLFAGTDGDGVWKRPLSEIATRIDESPNKIPVYFELCQNFPNPFNPTTTISFRLPSKSYISLKVFDVLGREVATLVNGELSAGDYSRRLNAGGLASGIYFYRLRANSFSETKKLVLLR